MDRNGRGDRFPMKKVVPLLDGVLDALEDARVAITVDESCVAPALVMAEERILALSASLDPAAHPEVTEQVKRACEATLIRIRDGQTETAVDSALGLIRPMRSALGDPRELVTRPPPSLRRVEPSRSAADTCATQPSVARRPS